MNTSAKQLFGARLKKARVTAGLSQEDMAEALLVSRQAISKWERGDSSPTALQLGELATMCCVCAHTLLFGAPYRDPVVSKLISGWLVQAATQGEVRNGNDRTDGTHR
ncbi:helix-turn-helix transcriptional regulator [Comamonas antarctica]|uniref:helix-turn-helix domain-containing protein n=1 Tax=Comamonas antarctica TaxID=2743470 RepID=UPI0028EAAFE8|nr:helix-turn-helix transcriptional regulator [Comamonas antarctica]